MDLRSATQFMNYHLQADEMEGKSAISRSQTTLYFTQGIYIYKVCFQALCVNLQTMILRYPKLSRDSTLADFLDFK